MAGAKRGTDPGHRPFEYLVGVTLPRWRGVNKQGSSAWPADHELRDGVNIRPTLDGHVSRPGQSKLITSSVGLIEGMYESSDRGAPSPAALAGFGGLVGIMGSCTPAGGEKLYITIGGGTLVKSKTWSWDGASLAALGVSHLNGRTSAIMPLGTCLLLGCEAYNVGPTLPPEVRRQSPGGGAMNTWLSGFALINNDAVVQLLYLPDDGGTDRLLLGMRQVSAPAQQYVLSTSNAVAFTTEFQATAAGGYYHIYLAHRAADNKVYVAAHHGATMHGLYVRTVGGASYSELSRDFGDVMISRSIYVNSSGRVLVGGVKAFANTATIWVYPGFSASSLLQEAHSAGATSGDGGVTAIHEFNLHTYYGWKNGSGHAVLGKFDGDPGSYTDSVFNFATSFPTDNPDFVADLIQYGDSLYALGKNSGAQRTYLYKSAGSNTASWSKLGEVTDNAGAGDSEPWNNMHMAVL